jgi:hypothetical protein
MNGPKATNVIGEKSFSGSKGTAVEDDALALQAFELQTRFRSTAHGVEGALVVDGHDRRNGWPDAAVLDVEGSQWPRQQAVQFAGQELADGPLAIRIEDGADGETFVLEIAERVRDEERREVERRQAVAHIDCRDLPRCRFTHILLRANSGACRSTIPPHVGPRFRLMGVQGSG